MSSEYRVEFVEGRDQKGAENQAGMIEELGKLGWEWAGFVSVSRTAVVRLPASEGGQVVGAATETAGMFLYFKRVAKNVSLGESMRVPRAVRRQAAREAVKVKGRAN